MAEKRMDHIDADWQRIRTELADPAWDFRTVDGLSRATGLSAERISKLLSGHHDEVRVSNVPDKEGRLLYTLTERPMKLREVLANVRAFITKSP
jgi:hypothetical protein